jgi:glutamate 5-kinase
MHADLLIILSNVDGLYDCDPQKTDEPKLIETVSEISDELMNACGKASAETSVGGMAAKLEAARIATLSGIGTILANGEQKNILRDIFTGNCRYTYFQPRGETISGRKRWIAFGAAPHGHIMIDSGAREAIVQKGRSLLPSGIIQVNGKFNKGDTVSIIDGDNKEIARGLANYSSEEIGKIKGLHSSKILEILGQKDYDEVVHRDNLALL